ncbi:MAG: aminotransferase class I/II-fold pyridoxal phosphate-dependent enzyme [Erysipelotrichaceae bacterium]|nr:aminotransferase class I/II-fold pyridoxal phosphate-dependent enzyme [Erysipelotrichaceae bacterium]MBQ2232501.1 aminotransferase class I/II-fold pyridoxal phosphate-dependent enzyme [Erysipelotrichaceae bacterium]MEE3424504.1 aminotransferase class I/II-fold pyridoxal phosphate-dependent enzyme [Erysipelotrichaceae bacterium]
MKFVRKNQNIQPYVDTIFSVVQAAKADPEAINATAGCLYDEEGKMFTYNCVYESERKIPAAKRAAYAASPAGNKEYLQLIGDFVLDKRVNNHYEVMATPGGTGAIATAISTCLDEGDEILFPEIAWGNYKVIANEHNLKMLTYDVYDLEDLFAKIDQMKDKVFLVINSPCQNPLGHAYTLKEWEAIFEKLNSLDKEVVLLCDIAYIDYATGDPKAYFSLFNRISDRVLVLLAASCSKAFSYYGQRLGALIAINNDEEFLKHYINLCSRLARATWSNLNNAAMLNIADILKEHRKQYDEELEAAKMMLKARTNLFIRQAEECGLELYASADGFFVTIRFDDNTKRDEAHQRLIDHHIYTIKVNKGIRVGLCSVPLAKVDGFAKQIKELM